ncbi:SixA phosphatase family protein [Sphingomonas turrisvirgatae]|uniref:Histidine phosphatase family protein n=1 Tax=Sphingomonas turrisvirgatae TaxID=1888892 RepID=A0A1E3LYV9_9SPHN|nr:histidine phosphatase family protein [Sphingomonas turrisvirgatae]ODP38987.1 histidine phosphatase family protein [Sphingomonas turrisvirgatae]
MKTLTLLRHAKSSWDDPVSRDFDRPLNARGRKAAVTVGRHMRSERLSFDHVVASPAVRIVETVEEIEAGYGSALAPAWDRRVYLASASSLLDVVHELPAGADSALLIGHNPGLEDLILLLIPDRSGDVLRDSVEEKFPTAALAVMTFDVESWDEVSADGGILVSFTRPRDLDPALGPTSE